ncbi:acyl carrier protein [Curvibacter sp. CHRR-16]|uniref:acyl carrier protein n=1 Tax=Curvibacter sp. CHRR-16 TaxID=2835872 RepID=UPI001BDB4693|nr:acyl carrier protein [Curvibacter sp. CHRR-16]MBT0568747.1 acyl carrier protein [Curvibacter sp. CHRR-16]
MTKDEILSKLRDILFQTFEIAPERVELKTHLFEELDLDSIDAIDLAIKVQELTGKRIKPEDFKTVRTVADVVQTVQGLLVA